MRKQLIWIIAFLLLAFWGDRMVGYFLKKATKNSQFRYSRLYHSTETAEVLFVGNSRGLNFYQPEAERLLQMPTMNLSYNGMPADLAKCLVMDYLDHHVPPKVMVVDVTLCDRDNDGLKSGFNLYTPFSRRLDTLLRGMHDEMDAWKGRKIVYGGMLSRLYRHNSEIFQRVLYHKTKSDEDWIVDRVIGDGAVEDTTLKSYQVRMFPNQVAHLKEMIDYAESKGVAVKLVINPYFRPFAESIRDSFLSPLKAYVEATTGKTVNDFSTAITAVDEVGDYQHINKKGSIHYMQILAENGLLAMQQTALSDNLNLPKVNESPTQTVFAAEKTVSGEPNPTVLPVFNAQSTPSVNLPKKKRRPKQADDFGFAVDTLFSY